MLVVQFSPFAISCLPAFSFSATSLLMFLNVGLGVHYRDDFRWFTVSLSGVSSGGGATGTLSRVDY